MQKTIQPYRTKRQGVSFKGRLAAAITLAVLVSFTSYPGMRPASAVGSSCNSITDCTNQINQTNAQVGNLKNQAVSYKDAITRLSSSISSKQGEIESSRSQQARLEKEIADGQAELARQRDVLGAVVFSMYTQDNMTTIEALATSNQLSDYVDKAEYKNAVQRQIQDTLASIAKKQSELNSQKEQVASLLSQQQSQAAALRSEQSEQSNMLNYNQSQQSQFNAQTAANQSKLAALIAAQRSANNSSSGGYYFLRFGGAKRAFSPTAYPYKNAGFSMSTAPGCNDNDGPDKWGYCTRQCVSYAAWAVEASGRTAPKYWSDAKKWVSRAKASGTYVDNRPQPGDVAISTAGTWGHAMYVEQVSGNMIYVSQYNQQLRGEFSYQWRKWQ
jgi:surface antigen/peptidoglycan hydrolase CwlO-like protein